MIQHKCIAALLLAMTCYHLQAQSDDPFLIGSGGGLSQNGSLYLTYSMGEPCISYTPSGGFWVTEGFQQPDRINLTAVEIVSKSIYTFEIFPNPLANILHIESTDPDPWQLVQIVNALGQPMLASPIVGEGNLRIDFSHLIPGIYMLSILDHTSTPVTQSFIKI